jgi:aldehyde:ferredoxin oxidoreductase
MKNISEMKNAHVLLNSFEYQPSKVEKGYTDKTLYINISDNTIKIKDVSPEMKEKFTGGRGYGMWYLWNSISESSKWNDPENNIIVGSGPIGGITQYPGAGKALVVSLSPLTGIPIDSNVGGYFAPFLKFSGFDAMEIQGKAEKDVIIFIDGNKGLITIEEAPEEEINTHVLCEQLTEMYALSEEDKQNVSVISSGAAADHTLIGMLNFSFYDPRRKGVRIKQAGRGGIGTVFRDKKIKAVVIRYQGTKGDSVNPADQKRLNKIGIRLHKEIHDLDDKQLKMRKVGTANLPGKMSAYDLLPVNNFKYGDHPDVPKIAEEAWAKIFNLTGTDGCWFGCTLACAKVVENFELKTGPYKGDRVIVDGPEYETIAGIGSCIGVFDPYVILEGNFYCDTYGLDTISVGTIIAFIMECYEAGIINKEITGSLELNFGNGDAFLELLHQMARGEGFGKVAGQGVRRLKDLFIKEYGGDPQFIEDIGMENKGLEYSQYVSKESLAQQGGYGLTNKGPQHDEAWLIFMDMINKQLPTFEAKAEGLYYFPLFRTWFGLNGLCKLPWNDIIPAGNALTDEPAKVPEHVDNYLGLFAAVTGKEITVSDLLDQSARVYNLQRVFNIKMGKGGRKFDSIPYRSAGPVTVEEYESRADRYDKQMKELIGVDPVGKTTEEKVKIMRDYRMDQYQQLVDAVYKRRGWNENGIPTLETLKRLGIDYPEVVAVVEKYL